jgi:hypothetical protein
MAKNTRQNAAKNVKNKCTEVKKYFDGLKKSTKKKPTV